MSPPRRHPCNHVASDAGFALLELIAVMTITGLLMMIAIPVFSSARRNSEWKALQSAVAEYDAATRQFMLDHGNRVPDWNDTLAPDGDWRSNHALGPYDAMGVAYINGGEPEIMGKVGVTFTETTALPTTTLGTTTGLTWYSPSNTQYVLALYVQGKFKCQLGNMQVGAGFDRCR